MDSSDDEEPLGQLSDAELQRKFAAGEQIEHAHPPDIRTHQSLSLALSHSVAFKSARGSEICCVQLPATLPPALFSAATLRPLNMALTVVWCTCCYRSCR